jgi:hypothetical protein
MRHFKIKSSKPSKPTQGASRAQDIPFQSSRGKAPASEPFEGGDGSTKLHRNQERPRVKPRESAAYGEDKVIREDHEGKVNISLVQAISDVIRPALELGYENAYEHAEGREDKAIPKELREARLLAKRYEKLMDEVDDLREFSTSASQSRESEKLYRDLQKSKKQCRELDNTLEQQMLDHSLGIDEILEDHKKELREQEKKWQGWYDRCQWLEKEQLPLLKKENSQYLEQIWQMDKDYKGLLSKQKAHEALGEEYWQLDTKYKVLLGKQKEHEALHDQYRQLEKEHRHLQVVQQDHEVAIEQTQKKFKMELDQLERKLERMNDSHKLELQRTENTLKAKHEAEVARLRNEQSSRIDRLKGDWDEKAQQYEAENLQLKENLESQQANADRIHAAAKKKWETEKFQLKEDYELSRAKLESIHADAMRQVEVEKEQLRDDFEARRQQLLEDFEGRKAELDSIHVDAMKQVEAEKSQMAMELKALEARLKKIHTQETDRLKREIQSRNKAFVSRDKFVPITDGVLQSAFFDICREVDTLSWIKWVFNNSPWTDDFQAQITDNQKRLQKHILQDTIWGVLFEFIFCSPFRVFGSEGKVLETQWNDACGKHRGNKNEFYTWPEANFGAEKWRYETMRSCQETLTTATSAYDPRTKLREAYSKSIDSIQEKIEAPLKMVSDLDQGMTKSIRGLIEKAAKTWILFGTQRCRILVVMQDLNTETESKGSKSGQTESVELVLRPELRRIGDSDGGSLDKEQVVAGCEGEAKKIMYSSS